MRPTEHFGSSVHLLVLGIGFLVEASRFALGTPDSTLLSRNVMFYALPQPTTVSSASVLDLPK